MSRLESLVIENYRGASSKLELEFDASKPIVVIFGENGTGKTTIADALDAVGNCSKGSIDDKSSTKARDHLPTIGKKAADIRISLKAGGSTWNTSLSGDNLSTHPSMAPKIRVLRRSHLQRLIEAAPAKRYEALKSFIDVEKVERSEKALQDAVTSAKQDFDSAVKRRADAEDQLEAVWLAEGSPGTNAKLWAKSVSLQETVVLENEAAQLRAAQQATTAAESALSAYKTAISSAQQRVNEAQVVEQEVAELPGIDVQQGMGLAGVLRLVQNHLKDGEHPDQCPVCEKGIPLAQLKADIQLRLDQLKQYDDLRVRRETATHYISVAQDSIEPKRAALLASAGILLEILKDEQIALVNASGMKLADYAALSAPSVTNEDESCQQAEDLIAAFSALNSSLADAETHATKQSGLINSITELNSRVESGITASEQLDQLKSLLKDAYDTIRLKRIEFTQKILDDVAAECNRLYGMVHPSEPIAISSLELDKGKRASLNQGASFEGHHDVPPQAYFSESHLDTLGFCFWLAIVKMENPKRDAIVVLDDVFTSVDAPHINRIAQLITDEASSFSHVLITTHQRLWRDIYRNPHGAGNLTQSIELQRWSLAKGISNYKTKLAVLELSDAIKSMPFDRQVAASKAGVLLEAILDYLALQYRCRVPRTPDNSYTLGELLDGTATLFKALEVDRPLLDAAGLMVSPLQYVKSGVTAILANLRASAFVRNQVGAHYNVAGSVISDADVADFSSLAVQLAEALSCVTCGQIPSKKAMTHFQCSCKGPGELRMLPLQV